MPSRPQKQARGPLTGIREPVYNIDESWQAQRVRHALGGLRHGGIARVASLFLLVALLLPLALAAVVSVIRSLF